MDADRLSDDEPAVVGPPWVRELDAPPGTAWTRADGLRLGDLVAIGDDAEDRWGRIVAIERADPPGGLRLRMTFEIDGAAFARCSQAPAMSTRYLRRLPEPRASVGVPVTTSEGLESAWRIFDRAWDVDGAVEVRLPARVASQLLRDRGWVLPRGSGEADRGWRAPTGERFSDASEAVRLALTAEYAEASTERE